MSLFFPAQRVSPSEMEVSDHRITSLAELPVPVTSQQEASQQLDRQLPILPERLDLTDLGPRYQERPGLSLMLPSRFQTPTPSEVRYPDRIPEPRPINPSSLSVPFATTSSNLAILQESRALSSLTSVGNSGQSNTYPMLSSDLYSSLNPQSQLSSSFSIPTSPQLSSSFIGYPPLHHTAGQNLQNSIHLPTGEVRTYEILGHRPSDYMPQRSLDIPMRLDRPLMSPASRLALENAQLREEERELQANQSPLHGDSTNVAQGHSPPRAGRNNGDSGAVWRPY